jgi:hypothetical protein
MANFSQNLRTRIAVVPETTWGTTPATPSMTLLPVTAFGLNLTRNELKDQSIRSDRMQRYSISGNSQVGGDIALDYCDDDTTDSLLACALRGAWSTNVLAVGTTDSSFTIEQGSLDTSLYSVYNGVKVDKAQINIALNDVVKMSFSCIGHGMVAGTAAITGATYGAEPQLNPFTHYAGTIKEGGSVCGYLSQVQIDIGSGSQANFALGDTFAKNITYGLAEVTGTATAYFQDLTLLNKFLNGTASSIDVTVTDGAGGSREFKMANIKYTSGTKQTANSGSITLNMAFTALYDATTGTPLQITRV